MALATQRRIAKNRHTSVASVLVDSGPVTATLPLREVPQEKWRDLMIVRASFMRTHLPSDCRRLLEFVEDAEQMFGPLGFASADDFVKRGLELDPQQVAWAVEGLQRMRPSEPIPYAKAIEIGKHGGDRKSEKVKDQVGNTKLISDGGMTVDYILARLDRDGHKALASAVRAKTMSANMAAIQAGFRKPPSPLKQLKKWYRKASSEERVNFAEWMQRTPEDDDNPYD